MAAEKHDDDLAFESLLRTARPQPSDAFVDATEKQLLGRPKRRRPILASVGLATGLAAAAVVASLAGAGPLRSDGHDAARAQGRCRETVVMRPERRGSLVRDRTGRIHVAYRTELVRRAVTRCDP